MTRAYLAVRVIPRASRNALGRDAQGKLRAHVTAPPADGAANAALIALLAARLGFPSRAFAIARGDRSREKLVSIEGCSPADLERALARVTG